jgi:spermidine synthase
MEYVEVARAESERGEIVLRERHDPEGRTPDALELRVNGVFVMDTAETTSERALAGAALKHVNTPRQVVVGGLGLGYTMHEVLADPRVERVVVVEIEDALVRWMRDGTVPHGPTYLADERVTVLTADISVAMAEATPAAYDLVLLDVDNGPGFLVYDANARVYEQEFLAATRRCLRPGGALVIWSSAEAPELAATLREVFGNVVPVPFDVSLQDREEHYWLYLSRVRVEDL